MAKQFTPDLKLKAVNYYHKINNYVKVCEVFECSERSLKRWVYLLESTNFITLFSAVRAELN
jgi:transposase-like protein